MKPLHRSLSLLMLAVLAFLTCFACSSAPVEDVGSTAQAITTTCTTNANCTGGVAPACGNAASGVCSAGICDYSLNWTGTTNCQCLEGDIQSCIPSGHSVYDGNQTCVVTSSSPLITNWATCQTGYGGHTPTVEFGVTSRNCSGTLECESFSDYPVCADYDKLSCEGIGNSHPWACKYRLAAEPGCSCIQYDIRACTITGGGTGHQTCVVNGTTSDPNNDWGQTTGWNTCS